MPSDRRRVNLKPYGTVRIDKLRIDNMDAPVLKTSRDQRRDAIVEVARQVFFEEGYAAASMSTIAARLGGSKGTLYNYFRSKEELFEAQVVEGCARFGEAAFERLSEGGSIAEVL